MIGGDVRVVYTKYDGSLHWHQTMTRLGEDEHGVWLGAREGSYSQKGTQAPVRMTSSYVMLMRPDVWWVAAFNARPCWTEIYCDITTPVTWAEPDQVTMVDLDLDVIRRFPRLGLFRRGAEVIDQDEFAEHQVRYSYPDDVITQARSASDWLCTALGDGSEPFATTYRGWLDQVRGPAA